MTHSKYIELAYQEAQKAFQKDEVPIGCVIVNSQGIVIASTHNQKETNKLATEHAELIAIREASRKLENWRLIGCSIYVTIEPCLMCVGALASCRIENIYYGWNEPKFGALHSQIQFDAINYGNHRFKETLDLSHEPSKEIMSDFFLKKRLKNL